MDKKLTTEDELLNLLGEYLVIERMFVEALQFRFHDNLYVIHVNIYQNSQFDLEEIDYHRHSTSDIVHKLLRILISEFS